MKKSIPFPLYKQFMQEGQQFLKNQVVLLVSSCDKNPSETLSKTSDAFTDPLLFAFFFNQQPITPIQQLLFGYNYPSKKSTQIKVYANAEGTIELPPIGYLLTSERKQLLTLSWDSKTANIILQNDAGKNIEYRLEPYIHIPGTPVTICSHSNELLDPLFVNEQGEPVDIKNIAITKSRVQQLSRAFELIQQAMPDYYEQLITCTQRIYLYKGEQPYSFASIGAHGIAFLQTNEEDDEVFFSEDLIHQCGHIVFSAISAQRSFFTVPDDTSMQKLNGESAEGRSIFVALHGIFTEALMSYFWYYCYTNNVFSGFQQSEAMGRFALIFTRFGIDLRSFYNAPILNEEGKNLVNHLYHLYVQIIQNCGGELQKIDISNQSYCFDRNKMQTAY